VEKALEKAQAKFIGYISSVCDDFGLNRFVAQLYGILYMSDRPLSLDEISERLGASKGNVSINIRELERWGAVRKIWVKGSRKDYYEAELDIKKIFFTKMRSSLQKRLSEVSNMIDEFNVIIGSAGNELSEEERGIVKVYQQRLHKIEELKELASNAIIFAEKLSG